MQCNGTISSEHNFTRCTEVENDRFLSGWSRQLKFNAMWLLMVPIPSIWLKPAIFEIFWLKVEKKHSYLWVVVHISYIYLQKKAKIENMDFWNSVLEKISFFNFFEQNQCSWLFKIFIFHFAFQGFYFGHSKCHLLVFLLRIIFWVCTE